MVEAMNQAICEEEGSAPLLNTEAGVLEGLHGAPVVRLKSDEELHEVDESQVDGGRGEPEEQKPVVDAKLPHVGQHVVEVNII